MFWDVARNECSDWADITSLGRLFHTQDAATGKARLPTDNSLTCGTVRQSVLAERRARRPGTSATRMRGICLRLHHTYKHMIQVAVWLQGSMAKTGKYLNTMHLMNDNATQQSTQQKHINEGLIWLKMHVRFQSNDNVGWVSGRARMYKVTLDTLKSD